MCFSYIKNTYKNISEFGKIFLFWVDFEFWAGFLHFSDAMVWFNKVPRCFG
jgi:hypothetical protein